MYLEFYKDKTDHGTDARPVFMSLDCDRTSMPERVRQHPMPTKDATKKRQLYLHDAPSFFPACSLFV